jgi:hypothetical protein
LLLTWGGTNIPGVGRDRGDVYFLGLPWHIIIHFPERRAGTYTSSDLFKNNIVASPSSLPSLPALASRRHHFYSVHFQELGASATASGNF